MEKSFHILSYIVISAPHFFFLKNTKYFRHTKYVLFPSKEGKFNVIKHNKMGLEVVLIDKHILFDIICVENACDPDHIAHK